MVLCNHRHCTGHSPRLAQTPWSGPWRAPRAGRSGAGRRPPPQVVPACWGRSRRSWRRDILGLGCERWPAEGAPPAARLPAGWGRGAGFAGRVPPSRRLALRCARLSTLSGAKSKGSRSRSQGESRGESFAPSFRPLLFICSCWRARPRAVT